VRDDGAATLWQLVRPRVVARYLGELCLPMGISTLVPVIGAVVLGEPRLAVPHASVGMVLVGTGWVARRARAPAELHPGEALAVAGLVFLLASLVMTWPVMSVGLDPLDAFFEATSGVTTTGLSTLPSLEGLPRTFLLTRAWLQWMGGLGFVVMSLGLSIESDMASRRLGARLLPDLDVVGSSRQHAREVLGVYGALTLVGMLGLIGLGAAPFDAIVYGLAAISTGGFAPRDSSLAELSGWLQGGVLVMSVAGAVSLSLYHRARRRGWRLLTRDVEVRTLAVLCVVLALVMVAISVVDASLEPLDAVWLALSAQSTTGFAPTEVGSISPIGKLVLLVPMLIGGSHGSTAGGIKVLRLLMILGAIRWIFVRIGLPRHAVWRPRLQGEPVDEADARRALVIAFLFMMVAFASALPFVAMGCDPLDSAFDVVSALGTVGLSSGVTSHDLPPFLKLVLCANMLLGRVEILALLVVLSPRSWIRRRKV